MQSPTIKLLIKISPFICVIILLMLEALLLAKPINLLTADLGRHIKNGEIIITNLNNPSVLYQIFHTNFYSYTLGSSNFINHHWLSGIILYLVVKSTGFYGLSIFYITLSMLTLLVIILASYRRSNFLILMSSIVIMLPIISSRAEIRPEVFSYLLFAVFFYILTLEQQKIIPFKRLYLLPILEVIWINLHISFILGLALIFTYAFVELIQKIRRKQNSFLKYFWLGAISMLATLINPSFLKGVLYVFQILPGSTFANYRVLENQSIPFLENLGLGSQMHFTLYKICLLLVVVSFIAAIWKKQYQKQEFWILLILSAVFGFLGFSGIRYFPFFGLIAIVALSHNFSLLVGHWNINSFKKIASFGTLDAFTYHVSIAIILISLSYITQFIQLRGNGTGIGLANGNENSANFFINNHLSGPIFNNYDIGGYLIYNLFPKEKVFVDNRPEAYTPAFFNDVLIPAQEDPDKFDQLDQTYHFNTIFFYYHDATSWGQKFLIDKINDPKWAPVYVDGNALIFVKRVASNQNLINKYEIPKSTFSVTTN